MPQTDLDIIGSQPIIKIWGEDFENIDQIKAFKGKFVVTKDGKLFAKLFPKSEWGNIEFFHNHVVQELGVRDAESPEMKQKIVGGGKIEVELVNGYVECKLYGKSTIYGLYDPAAINAIALESELKEVFALGEIPALVIPDFKVSF